MGSIHYNMPALKNSFFYRNLHAFPNQEIHHFHIPDAHTAEVGQVIGTHYAIFRTQVKEVFKRHVIKGALYQISIRKVIDYLKQEVFEHTDRGERIPAIVRAVPIPERFMNKAEINQFLQPA